MRRVKGSTLSGELDRYCLRLGVTKAAFSRASGVPRQTLCGMLRVERVSPETVEAVRGFILANPDALPTDAPVRTPKVAAPVAVPVPVPVVARSTIGEQIATAMLATPSDLVRHVAGRWPDVWTAVLHRARRDNATPGAALVAAIERGLDLDVTCG